MKLSLLTEAVHIMRFNPNNPNNLSRCDDLFILAWAFLSLVPFRWGQTTEQGASSDSLGTLQNYDGDSKENVKKTIGLMSKTTTLHVHHAFLYISLPSLHNYDVKWPNFKFTWERERQADKFYQLCQNLGAVPSLQLQSKFPSFK